MGSGRLLQPHGRPPFLEYSVACLRIQHGNTEPTFVKRVVFRLRCLLSHDIHPSLPLTNFFLSGILLLHLLLSVMVP
jgi:hypothetical protein